MYSKYEVNAGIQLCGAFEGGGVLMQDADFQKGLCYLIMPRLQVMDIYRWGSG